MERLGGEAIRAHHIGGGLFFGLRLEVVGEDVHIRIAGLAALFLDAGDLLLDLGFHLVRHKVDGGIHVGGLLRGVDVQPFAGNGHFTAMPELVHGQHHGHFQPGGLAEEAPQLFHAAAGILLEMIGRVKVLEGKGNVHMASGCGLEVFPAL